MMHMAAFQCRNTSIYYLFGDGSYIVPGHNYMCEVIIDGISHTSTVMAPGNIGIAADGLSVSWGFGEPGGGGGQVYVYRFPVVAGPIYSVAAIAPSTFTFPVDPYTPGDGLHRVMLSQNANQWQGPGQAFQDCSPSSRFGINTHSERSDINK
jgi:hypothetical protein